MGTKIPLLPEKSGGTAPPILAHLYRGQTVRWIKMKLGIQIGRIVLDGDPAPALQKRHGPTQFLRHRQVMGDLIDWNLGVCPSVRPSVRTSLKNFFSDFHQIWCVGRPRPDMCTSVTSTLSKVKVKVTEIPKLQKLHFSMSSSAALAWSSKLMVGGDTAYQSPIFKFPSRKAITSVQTLRYVDISRNSNGHISVLHDATVTWLVLLVGRP